MASILLIAAGISAALLVVFHLVSTYNRLRQIPGPKAASLTNFWFFTNLWTGGDWKKISPELHQKYGPVVRYGPNRVMFSDPAAIPIVFSTSHVLEKGDSYGAILAIVNGKEVASMITIRPESRHTAIRKALGGAIFTPRAISEYENYVDETISLLVRGLAENGPRVDISRWFSFFAFDTLSRIAFSEDLGFMEKQEDVDGALAGARGRFSHWHYWQAVPWLEALIFKNRFARTAAKSSTLGALALMKISAAEEKDKVHSQPTLLDKYMEAHKNHPDIIDRPTLMGLTISTIHAGADSTAAAMTIALYHLLKNPEKLERLLAELEKANLSDPPTFAELNKIPYLEAIFKETLRLTAISVGPIERIVPPGGLEIAGVSVPEGTTVSVSHLVTNFDSSIWGEDVHQFNPDRWVNASEEQRRYMERCNLAFSAGKRMCLGQHIAWLEMKKVLPRLLRISKMSLVDPDAPLSLNHELIGYAKELLINVEFF